MELAVADIAADIVVAVVVVVAYYTVVADIHVEIVEYDVVAVAAAVDG